MLCFKAHAKINWTLDIHGTRPDGYHLMEMLMQTVEMHDTLWLEDADVLTLEGVSAPVCPENPDEDAMGSGAVPYDERNLAFRAARLLQESCGVSRGARMRLHKAIPSGAGMGGGSADAAAALWGLNQLWGLGLSMPRLLELGLRLGADVPFLLMGGLAHVSGIGEVIRPLAPAPEIWLTLLQPCGGLSTREVFGAFDALDPASLARPDTDAARSALLNGNLPALRQAMNNVLEGVSARVRPAIPAACEALERLGAQRAMMTGSGSVVYGVFASREAALRAQDALSPIALQNGWGEVWVTRTLAKNDLHS